MGWDQLRERVEQLLREPDNLFGPPTGRGYDYVGAALTVAALALGALSGGCLFAVWGDPGLHPAFRPVLLVVAAPFCVGVWFLWPLNLLVGWVGAAAVWYATLHAAGCLAGLRRCGRWARACSAVVSVAGWAVGLVVAFGLGAG